VLLNVYQLAHNTVAQPESKSLEDFRDYSNFISSFEWLTTWIAVFGVMCQLCDFDTNHITNK